MAHNEIPWECDEPNENAKNKKDDWRIRDSRFIATQSNSGRIDSDPERCAKDYDGNQIEVDVLREPAAEYDNTQREKYCQQRFHRRYLAPLLSKTKTAFSAAHSKVKDNTISGAMDGGGTSSKSKG